MDNVQAKIIEFSIFTQQVAVDDSFGKIKSILAVEPARNSFGKIKPILAVEPARYNYFQQIPKT